MQLIQQNNKNNLMRNNEVQLLQSHSKFLMQDLCGSIKVFDGIYVGNQIAAKDEQLIFMNHITRIVNCTDIQNYFQSSGVKYKKIQLIPTVIASQQNPTDQYGITPSQMKLVYNHTEINKYIDNSRELGECVLIVGSGGCQVPYLVVSIYTMSKFSWSLIKTLEYINFRIKGIELNVIQFKLLQEVQQQLIQSGIYTSFNWQDKCKTPEELLLRNTYINATGLSTHKLEPPKSERPKKNKKVQWLQVELIPKALKRTKTPMKKVSSLKANPKKKSSNQINLCVKELTKKRGNKESATKMGDSTCNNKETSNKNSFSQEIEKNPIGYKPVRQHLKELEINQVYLRSEHQQSIEEGKNKTIKTEVDQNTKQDQIDAKKLLIRKILNNSLKNSNAQDGNQKIVKKKVKENTLLRDSMGLSHQEIKDHKESKKGCLSPLMRSNKSVRSICNNIDNFFNMKNQSKQYRSRGSLLQKGELQRKMGQRMGLPKGQSEKKQSDKVNEN